MIINMLIRFKRQLQGYHEKANEAILYMLTELQFFHLLKTVKQ